MLNRFSNPDKLSSQRASNQNQCNPTHIISYQSYQWNNQDKIKSFAGTVKTWAAFSRQYLSCHTCKFAEHFSSQSVSFRSFAKLISHRVNVCSGWSDRTMRVQGHLSKLQKVGETCTFMKLTKKQSQEWKKSRWRNRCSENFLAVAPSSVASAPTPEMTELRMLDAYANTSEVSARTHRVNRKMLHQRVSRVFWSQTSLENTDQILCN